MDLISKVALCFIGGLVVNLLFSQYKDSSVYLHNGIPLEIPADFLNNGNLTIYIPKEFYTKLKEKDKKLDPSNKPTPVATNTKPEITQKDTTPTLPLAPVDVSSLLVKAYLNFHRKNFVKTLDYLDQAEGLDHKNVLAKSMKGSLFYVMGFTNLAKQKWEESLKLNPNQDRIKAFLLSIEKNSPAVVLGETPTKSPPPLVDTNSKQIKDDN